MLDEESFQKLLQAAHVLQEHNKHFELLGKSNGDATPGRDDISIHRSAESSEVGEPAVLELIVARTRKLTGAAGVAVGVLEGHEIVYHAANGTAIQDEGLRLPIDSSLGSECISQGRLFRFPGTEKPPQDFVQLCHQCGVKELIAAPILARSKVVGVLEVRADRLGTFRDAHLRITTLMAGLVAEAICGPDDKRAEAASAEEKAVLDAIETIKPELERLVRARRLPIEALEELTPQTPSVPVGEIASTGEATAFCRCGNRFEGNEKFCGKCGTARFAESRRDMQSKWASLWYLQQAKTAETAKPVEDSNKYREETTKIKDIPASLEEIVSRLSSEQPADAEAAKPEPLLAGETLPQGNLKASAPVPDASPELETGSTAAETRQKIAAAVEPVNGVEGRALDSDLKPGTAIVPVRIVPPKIATQTQAIELLPRTPAYRAWEWWANLQRRDRASLATYWNRQRANVWMAISVVLLLAAIFMNNRSGPQVANATANRRHPAAPSLTLFERLLVSLGIAEAPPPPAYYGNPAAKVWVDVHTALYYCPGADLYGKTDGGRVTTQKDAQQDQFEPADRRACD